MLKEWQTSLTPKEKELHALAKKMLKKSISGIEDGDNDGDNGSYFPEKSHAFRAWLAKKQSSKS